MEKLKFPIELSKQQIFDLWALTYDWLFPSVFYQAVHQRLLEYVQLPPMPRILDLGCGTGRLLSRLAEEIPQLQGTGLDFSTEMLHQARERNRHGLRLNYTSGSAESLPFAPNEFDGVFCTISFLHYPRPEVVFAQIYRVLKPGGQFYWVDSTISEYGPDVLKLPVSPGGMTLYNRAARERLGRESGLAVLRHQYLIGSVLLTIFIKPG
ncbi:MAG: class I SAM-dependent methyltransferase [Cyanobacteriota bacterium]|nr:class I SAM-dependent methyltransferase [Cyanobacteriota bacterium]